MNRDECYIEEWWNFATSFALLVPAEVARRNDFRQSAVVVAVTAIASALRHVPRRYLGAHGLDVFRGFDFTMIGVLLVVVYLDVSGTPQRLGSGAGWAAVLVYAALTNALFFAANVDFPWNIAVYYYVLPIGYILCLRLCGTSHSKVGAPQFSAARKALLGLLVVAAVLVRMTEQPGLMDKIGFDDGGTTCILDHGIWHVLAAAVLCVVLMVEPGNDGGGAGIGRFQPQASGEAQLRLV